MLVILGLVMLSLRSLNRMIRDVHRCMVMHRQQRGRQAGGMSLLVIGFVFPQQVECSNIRYVRCRRGC